MTRSYLFAASAGVLIAALGSVAHAQGVHPSVRPYVVKSVPTQYPAEARQRNIEGSGVLGGEVDFETGKVLSVRMEKSTGSKILDQAALRSYRQWQFKARLIRKFRVPITFQMANRT
jgi:TonB family protein